MSDATPTAQRAIQLVGPDELKLNEDKPVIKPGPTQVLARVEVVGLCFSDLKLLKQFSGHVRKSDVVSGMTAETLGEVPSYVPGDKPTVPGHETVVRIMDTGSQVEGISPGDRFLVQTDYRWLKTENSNAAFGYNFEGALQEYVLMDQRVITSPEGDSMLIPAAADLPASAVALVEPWACVEDSYAVQERQGLKSGGHLLVVISGDTTLDISMLADVLDTYGVPAKISCLLETDVSDSGVDMERVDSIDSIPDETLDDVIFFGAEVDLLEQVLPKVAAHGLVNIVQGGSSFGRPVTIPVGRVHYGGIRLTGTTGSDPGDGYRAIPTSGEIREGDRIDVVGAGGPMGSMHAIRNICQGVPNVSVEGGDLSRERLGMLAAVAEPLAAQNGVGFKTYNPKADTDRGAYDYIALMVPVPALVSQAVLDASPRGIVNIFAGIPAHVNHAVDLDIYVEKQLYFIGTSGSVLEDMKIVLRKVEAGTLDTNLSVAAISGLDGAVEGIRAVEKQLMPGKIIVYPSCKGLGLTPLDELESKLPEVAACLEDGHWTKAAEVKLLEVWGERED